MYIYIYKCCTHILISDVRSGILSGGYPGIYSDILFGIYSGNPSGIFSGILSGTYSDILSGTLSGICSGSGSGQGAHCDDKVAEEGRKERRKEKELHFDNM